MMVQPTSSPAGVGGLNWTLRGKQENWMPSTDKKSEYVKAWSNSKWTLLMVQAVGKQQTAEAKTGH